MTEALITVYALGWLSVALRMARAMIMDATKADDQLAIYVTAAGGGVIIGMFWPIVLLLYLFGRVAALGRDT